MPEQQFAITNDVLSLPNDEHFLRQRFAGPFLSDGSVRISFDPYVDPPGRCQRFTP